MKCKNCNNQTFYTLQNGYIKCKKCAKKYSVKKLQKDEAIVKAFCENQNALETSKELKTNYRTIKDRFDEYRHKIALYLEDEYNSSIKDYSEYEEFYYFKQRDKNKKKKNLYEAINIMGNNSRNNFFIFLNNLIQFAFDKIIKGSNIRINKTLFFKVLLN